jgi:hypothetical protein
MFLKKKKKVFFALFAFFAKKKKTTFLYYFFKIIKNFTLTYRMIVVGKIKYMSTNSMDGQLLV